MSARLRALRPETWRYLVGGVTGRLNPKQCPCCRSIARETVDRKHLHVLEECQACGILYRFPYERLQQSIAFYQSAYVEPGLTTDLPSAQELQHLLATGFKGSGKDFSYHLKIFAALGLSPGARILDFGANWGYLTFQLRVAGFDADGFEISRTRARFARNLGLEIMTDKSKIRGRYDAVYSSHVLEHTCNPRATLIEQLEWVRPGGLVIAHTPNGSKEWRRT